MLRIEPSRREFLRTGIVVAGALGVGSLAVLEDIDFARGLEHAPIAALRERIGTVLRIRRQHDVTTIDAHLIDVVVHGAPSRRAPFDQFTLVLDVGPGVELDAGVHEVEHAEFGCSSLMTVPVLHGGPCVPGRETLVHEINVTRPARV